VSLDDRFLPIVRGIELLLAEKRSLIAVGPQLKIVHRFWVPGTLCLPGEEILGVCWIHRGRELPLRLSLSSRILIDYLARCRLPQTAAQIEAGILVDTFYLRHGSNGKAGSQIRMIKKRAVKVFVQRVRVAFRLAFLQAGVRLDPRSILVSQATDTNVTTYRLKVRAEWSHV
jgi:hypothetical protein